MWFVFAGSSVSGAKRWHHLRDRVDIHVHAGARPPLTLSPRRRHHAQQQPHRSVTRYHRYGLDAASGHLNLACTLHKTLDLARYSSVQREPRRGGPMDLNISRTQRNIVLFLVYQDFSKILNFRVFRRQ